MSRINTNVQSLVAQRVLNQNNRGLGQTLERLSTGLKINRGGDDPAGLIASENLRAEKTALGAAISNAERAEQVVNIAEGGLQEISGLLNELEGLVTTTANTAGLSDEEREANQLQVDSIIQTIDRLASATSFQGNKLLNGNLDYTASDVNAEVASFKINGAKLAFGGTQDVDVVVTGSAQIGGLFLSTGGTLDLAASTDSFTFEITGAKGSRELSFASGTTLADIAAAINTFTDVTGVEAAASGTGVRIVSDEVGSDQFVSVKIVDDGGIGTASDIGIYDLAATDTATAATGSHVDFNATSAQNGYKDEGLDVQATINGIAATTKGATASINSDFLQVEVKLNTGGSAANAQNLGSLAAFTITGGGADFQLGPEVDIAGKVSLGLANVAARNIGRVEDGSSTYFLSDLSGGKSLNLVDGDLTNAQKVISETISNVSSLRGRIGAFQKNTVGATIRSLGVSLENTTAAESAIRDADFAAETAGLTRSQILVQSTTNILGIANSQPQNVLALLG